MSVYTTNTNVRAQGSPRSVNKPTTNYMTMMDDMLDELRRLELEPKEESTWTFHIEAQDFEDLDEDDERTVILVITTEYERKVGNLKSKNSKDKRKKREAAANYFIKEENERVERHDRDVARLISEEQLRCEMMEDWRRETAKGLAFWTPERMEEMKTDDQLRALWQRWVHWVPPPPMRPGGKPRRKPRWDIRPDGKKETKEERKEKERKEKEMKEKERKKGKKISWDVRDLPKPKPKPVELIELIELPEVLVCWTCEKEITGTKCTNC